MSSPRQFALASDLDGTLLGHEAGTKAFTVLWAQLAGTAHLIYATGRSFAASAELLGSQSVLPRPDAVVCCNGGEVYWPDDGLGRSASVSQGHDQVSQCPDRGNHVWRKDEAWASCAKWDREAVVLAAQAAFGELAVPGEDIEQTATRISYYADPAQAGSVGECCKSLRTGAGVHVCFSQGVFLDITPAGVTKGAAVRHCADRLGCAFEKTVVAGDTGNDQTLLADGGGCGIVVANALPELREWCDQTMGDYYFQAAGCFAAGVLEGLAHYGFIRRDLRTDELVLESRRFLAAQSLGRARKRDHNHGAPCPPCRAQQQQHHHQEEGEQVEEQQSQQHEERCIPVHKFRKLVGGACDSGQISLPDETPEPSKS
eukprot:TRINITY_DN3221_c0_g1_i2.p1 TRINITY_DN3221_c0_g1~~TRINITY_DN3221_c0_g1_i2.p1  ORF type:complete len:372 (+),score=49.12 TRINITY_DN3221_c0_g1_i2:247-1362(+)